MSIRSGWLAVMVGVASCGTPDATAIVGGPGDEPELEAASTIGALSNAAATWLPMQEGNQWVLQSTTGTSTRTVSLDSVANGVGHLTGLHTDDLWVGTASSTPNTLYAWTDASQSWSAFLRFGYATTGWKFGYANGPCQTFNLKRTATNLSVTTPAGTFANARTIGMSQVGGPTVRCAPIEIQELTFAPDVGLVSLVTGTAETFTLKSARVGAKSWPAGNTGGGTLKSVLKSDFATYTSKPNTIRCITTPCPTNDVTARAHFTYTVVNGTSSSQTWQFATGCQFDIELRDVSSSVVRRLSDARICTQALSSITLAPGASKVFTAELELKDSDGRQLDGSFTAKALITPRIAAPSVAATAALTARIVN